jgi:hypothetical protein
MLPIPMFQIYYGNMWNVLLNLMKIDYSKALLKDHNQCFSKASCK